MSGIFKRTYQSVFYLPIEGIQINFNGLQYFFYGIRNLNNVIIKQMNSNNRQAQQTTTIKVVTIGDASVGKTSIIRRYSDNIFNNHLQPTLCIDTKLKNNISIGDQQVGLIMWDTAGQESYRTISRSYYKGSHGIMIVYDVTDQKTFEGLSFWISEIETYAKENVCVMLVGNKCDLYKQRRVKYQEGYQLAKKHNFGFIEVSAKSGSMIYYAFEKLIEKILARKILQQQKNNQKMAKIASVSNQKLTKKNFECVNKSKWLDCLQWLKWII